MSYESVILADDPAAYWPLTDPAGSTTAVDLSGNGHTMTATAVTFGVPGIPAGGTSASFAPASGSGLIAEAYDGPASSPISFEYWCNLAGQTASSFGVCIMEGDPGSFNAGWGTELLPEGDGLWVVVGNGTAYAAASPNLPVPPADGWVYVAGVYDGTTLTSYYNGTATGTATLTGPMVPYGNTVSIGRNQTYTNTWAGSISNVAVYGTALTADQVAAHYAAGTPPSPSGLFMAGDYDRPSSLVRKRFLW